MKKLAFTLLLLFLAACQNGQIGAREKGAVGGGALGAGLGAIIGHQVGKTGAGVAIGSAIGALSGALVGDQIDAQDQALAETDRRIEEQDRVIRENQQLIRELKGQGLDVRSTDRGVVVNLPDVLFEFDRARLTPEALGTVGEISRTIAKAGDRHISVEGHTDSVGTVGYNQRLSEERARSVADELTASGLPRRQISTRGFGESDPVASNSTAGGRAKNRRVEVIIENN